MALENQQSNVSQVSFAHYEAVETSYDPGQFVTSNDISNTPSKGPPPKAKVATRHGYKPTALRWWFLCILVASLAVLIGLTEYNIRTLQVYNGDDLVSLLWSREDRDNYTETTRTTPKAKRSGSEVLFTFNETSTTVTSTLWDFNGVPLGSTYLSLGFSTATETPITTTSPETSQSQGNQGDGYMFSLALATSSETEAIPTSSERKLEAITTVIVTTTAISVKTAVLATTTITQAATTVPYTKAASTQAAATSVVTIFTTTTAYPENSQSYELQARGDITTTASPTSPTNEAISTLTSTVTVTIITTAAITSTVTLPGSTLVTTLTSSGSDPYLNLGYTTVVVTVTARASPVSTKSQDLPSPGLVISAPTVATPTVATPTSPTTEALETASTSDGDAYLSLKPTSSPITTSVQPTLDATPAKAANSGLQLGSETSQTSPISIGVIPGQVPSSDYLVPGQTSSTSMAKVGSETIGSNPGNNLNQGVTTNSQPSATGQKPSVTVVQETRTWAPSEVRIQETATNADGQTVVQTYTSISPGGTSVLQSSVSVLPGETLVAVPKLIETTIGASQEVVQVTFTDSQGHLITSSYATLLGGTPTFTTRSYLVATSLPAEDKVITVPSVVQTTMGGTTEVESTTFTGADGILSTSSWTTVLGGTPTSVTIPVVIATPVASGDVLTTLLTVVPTTLGGTTEVLPTAFTNAQGELTTSSYTTVLHGTPTSTSEWTVVPTPTYTSSAGAPSNGSDPSDKTRTIVYGIDLKEYVLGTFMPTILAVIVAYPVKLISINARLMQPFHALATADEATGATPESTMFLRFDTWFGAASLPLAIKRRQPVLAISDLLVLGAGLLAPIAAGAVSVHVPDNCDSHCLGTLEVSVVLGRILEALMAVMAAFLLGLIVLLRVFRWETGVSHNPWSIAGMASLCQEPEIRNRLQSIPRGLGGHIHESTVLKVLGESRYRLGDFRTPPSSGATSSDGYGVVAVEYDGAAKQLLSRTEPGEKRAQGPNKGQKRTQPFALLTWWGRCILLFVFSCVLIILTYYENSSANSGFERFMDSQGFGVSFFFTALGVVLGACMETVFRSVATVSPYLQMSNNVLPAKRSILLSPPTNAFYGIYSAVQQRHIFLGVLSFITLLSELCLPVTLSHVAFSRLETHQTQVVCAWLSIAILALMILVLTSSFFITWPHMPIDPRTVAGAMFYVCDSWMLETFHGMSMMGKKDRDLDIEYLRLKYGYGYIEGAVSGKQRMGVDVCGDTGEAAVIMRRDKMQYS